MTSGFPKTRIDKRYLVVFAIAVFVSWTVHEFAHWIVGEYLGYKMVLTLNSSYPLDGRYSNDIHYQMISAAGPIITLCEALFVFILIIHRKIILLYPFIFTCFYMRLFATIISFRHPNDEARISTALGIGKFTLPLIVTGILFALIYKVSRTYRCDTKFNLINLGLAILFSSILILTDMYFKVRLL